MAKRKSEAVAEEIVAKESVIEEAAPAEEEKKEQEPVMYVGPTIPGIAIQNRVYTEIPAGAQDAFKKMPELRNLFLQIEQYPMAAQMLREKKGFVYSAFNRALTLKGGNKS